MAWSYDLLSAREQELFGRLSVFPATLRPGSRPSAVAGTPPEDAAEDLLALVSKSMVAIVELEGSPTRYSLHETLRQFGAGQPQPGHGRGGPCRPCPVLPLPGRPLGAGSPSARTWSPG